MKKYSIFLIAVIGLSGCGIVYTNVLVPRSYRSATPAEVKSDNGDKTVSGKSCNQSVLFLVAWGNGGYAAAADKALESQGDSILYDVKADLQALSVLGLYTRSCTIVTGRVARVR